MKSFAEKLALAFMFLAVTLLMHGFVFMKLWNWFIISILPVSRITIAQAVSIALAFKYLYPKFQHDIGKMSRENFRKDFSEAISFSIAALIIGWTIKLFV